MFTESRTRKKKVLTQAVDILPAPKKTQRTIVNSKVNRFSILDKNPKVSITNKKEGNSNEKSDAKRTNTHISIKNILTKQQKEKEANKEIKILPKTPIKYEQLCLFWTQYAYILKERGMETFYNALIKRKPELIDEYEYALDVENQIQVDYIKPKLHELTTFLQSKLNNYHLKIIVRQQDHITEEVKYLTGNEKFKVMASKNPNLHVLKSVFNLDIEL